MVAQESENHVENVPSLCMASMFIIRLHLIMQSMSRQCRITCMLPTAAILWVLQGGGNCEHSKMSTFECVAEGVGVLQVARLQIVNLHLSHTY